MAYANARFGYPQTQADGAISRRRPSYLEEDDSAILDTGILDPDIMQSPEDAFHKPSFASSNGVLSPAESQGWDPHYGTGLTVDPGASNPHHEEHNGFSRQSGPHMPQYVQQHHPPAWTFEHGSGHCTPTTGAEFIPPPPPPHLQTQHYVHHRADSARGSFSHPPPPQQAQLLSYSATHPEGAFISAPQVQTPMSPHSHQDWMSMAQQEVECRPLSNRMRTGTPVRTTVDVQRRDRIRKKNGRIDIPHERNIQTIDDMIESTVDEDMLKELKQQKRLLRNREAAYVLIERTMSISLADS